MSPVFNTTTRYRFRRGRADRFLQWRFLPAPTQPGQVGGHEGVGKVAKLGPGAETSNLKIGDRVGIKWMAGVCGNCIPCLCKSTFRLIPRKPES
jgi:threonine dehydrogenase-like Zn-dependent dehydrogenase